MTWVAVQPFVLSKQLDPINKTVTATGVAAFLYGPPDPDIGSPQDRRNTNFMITNAGPTKVGFRTFPTATGVATATNTIWVLSGQTRVFSAEKGPYIAYYATGSALVQVVPGEGTI